MTDGEDDVLFDFSIPITQGMVRNVEELFDLLREMEGVNRERVNDAKFNSYIQIRIRSYNRERELVQSSLAKLQSK